MIPANSRCSNTALAEGAPYAWPAGTVVAWYYQPLVDLSGITHADVRSALAAAAASWSRECGVRCASATPGTHPQIWVRFEQLPAGPSELGLTDLPMPGTKQCVLRLNIDVTWTPDELAAVVLHEFGHALGMVHVDESIPAVMNPVYNPAVTTLQPPDVAQAVARYGGPPAATPPPPATTAQTTIHVSQAGPVTLELDVAAPGDYLVQVIPITPAT